MVEIRRLTITEYASKYDVSISTVRRRIKSGKIKYTYQDGKYFLKDEKIELLSPVPAQKNVDEKPMRNIAPPKKSDDSLELKKDKSPEVKEIENVAVMTKVSSQQLPPVQKEVVAEKSYKPLLDEIKKAYMQVLQEKEEQVLILKDEVSDLRTLVSVLETEVERLGAKNKLTTVAKTPEAAPVPEQVNSPKKDFQDNPLAQFDEKNWVYDLDFE